MAIRWVIGATLAIAGCSASDGTAAQDKAPGTTERAPSVDCSRFDYARCIALSPTERMRGVWLSGFERSSFLAGAEAVPNGPDRYGNAVWVDFAPDATVDPTLRAEMDRMGGTVAVAIEFDGRRSRDAGRYGHMGVADHVVVIDRIRSAHILGRIDPD